MMPTILNRLFNLVVQFLIIRINQQQYNSSSQLEPFIQQHKSPINDYISPHNYNPNFTNKNNVGSSHHMNTPSSYMNKPGPSNDQNKSYGRGDISIKRRQF